MKKGILTNILLMLSFLAGLSLLLYPTVSDLFNTWQQSRYISNYTHQVAAIDNTLYDALIQDARDHNVSLLDKTNPFLLSDEEELRYFSLLDVSESGILGYLEIPSLGETMAIYHGTDDTVLQVGVGHIPWSSLPVGGAGTHAVLSGHRGLPSARLFTDLDELGNGDLFLLRILDETLTYEVDQIRIVEPDEIDDLRIREGEDLCTLVTCTPYGINSHRLLVRGHRVDNQKQAEVIRVTADAMQVEPHLVAIAIAVPMLLVLLIILLITTRRKPIGGMDYAKNE